MEKHAPPDKMREDLDNLLARINALEVSAPDEYQKGVVKVLRALVEGQTSPSTIFCTLLLVT